MFLRRYLNFLQNKLKYPASTLFDSSVIILDGSQFEGGNRIGKKSLVSGKWGFGSYCGNNCNIQGSVGRFCSFGENCKTIFWKHPMKYPYVSTSPLFYSTRKQAGYTFARKQVFSELLPPPTFGNDIWVGSNVVFIGSVHIGDGAVILTNAVVTKDVEPYSICGGVPAKPIGYRYNQEDIEFLIGIKWWNNSIDWFRKNWELINDINLLKDHIKQME